MSNIPLHYQSLMEVSGRIHRQELSASEVTRALLERIDIHDKTLFAYSALMPDAALAAARVADEEIAAGNIRGPLHYTAPYDLSRSPTISIPCGFGAGSVSLGFQLIGRDFGEDVLLRAAHAYQQRTD